jgi:hypothetical protein
VTVELSGEAALGAEPPPFVGHPGVPDLGVIVVGPHLERQEVVQGKAPGRLQGGEDALGSAHQAKVDVPGRPGSRKSQLECQTALEHRRISEHRHDPREKAIEHEELPRASEVRAGLH